MILYNRIRCFKNWKNTALARLYTCNMNQRGHCSKEAWENSNALKFLMILVLNVTRVFKKKNCYFCQRNLTRQQESLLTDTLTFFTLFTAFSYSQNLTYSTGGHWFRGGFYLTSLIKDNTCNFSTFGEILQNL